MADVKSREQIEKDWWDAWWAEDFSWDGLAKQTWRGWTVTADGFVVQTETSRRYGASESKAAAPARAQGRKATLQDYWRADPATGRLRSDSEMSGEMIYTKGKPSFHKVHLPIEFQDKLQTGKATWSGDALDTIVAARLLAAEDTNEGLADCRAQFRGGVWLRGADQPRGDTNPISARYDFAAFLTAKFKSPVFGWRTTFERALFRGSAPFNNARIQGNILFLNAIFLDDTSFHGVSFPSFAQFNNVMFFGAANFVRATFEGEALFRNVSFQKSADFQHCVFNGIANFDSAGFLGEMRFTGVMWERLATFVGIIWPDNPMHVHRAFDQSIFRGALVLRESGFRCFAAFDGATLERGVSLDDVSEQDAARTFQLERKQAFKLGKSERDVNKRLGELERGCRVLKQAMERASNRSREQLLYRFELRARRKQQRLPFGEKTFSFLYALASDYGASVWRPFAALLLVVASFALMFFAWAQWLGLKVDPVTMGWQALDFSWANVFKPLSVLSAEDVGDKALANALLTKDTPGTAFAVRAVATLESLITIVLAFLFALAVRRRFQIS